jgi:hypothetical protein
VDDSAGCGRAVPVLHVSQDDGIAGDPIGWVWMYRWLLRSAHGYSYFLHAFE